jgi:uncharacterized protein
MESLTISKTTLRRFVLGKQGLWPGRRWAGQVGTAQALNAIEALQLDPLNVVARSHDIALWGRVLDYQPAYLDQATYQDRQFFDYGGSLFVYPIAELPFWRLHMQRRAVTPYRIDFVQQHQEALEQVMAAIQERGPLGNRDFAGNRRVNSYRGRKDTGVALFHWWLVGELMITRRQGFQRVYDLRARVVPPELDFAAPVAEAEEFFARKSLAFLSVQRERPWMTSVADYIQRRIHPAEGRAWLERLVGQGVAAPLRVEGSKETWYTLTDNLPLLALLEAGEIPAEWRPLGPTTTDEVTFLAPLEIASARGRANFLFDFEYVWEVYKPAEQRRWGYYTIPILYGDRLVGRLDPKLERKTNTLQLNGFWLEDLALRDQAPFVAALAGGLARFVRFLNANQLDFTPVEPPALRAWLQTLNMPQELSKGNHS